MNRSNPLALIARLSNMEAERIGEMVRDLQQVRAAQVKDAEQLERYRLDLSLDRRDDGAVDGHDLRAQVAFSRVADQALWEARQRIERSNLDLKNALEAWYRLREKSRVIEQKRRKRARSGQRLAERRSE